MHRSILWFSLLLTASSLPASAVTFYVDSLAGSDSNAGTSSSHPWQTLQKVNAAKFGAGDRILLKAGSKWTGQLALHSSGEPGRPILIDRYDKGPRPRIDGEGKVENVVELQNVEQVEVRNLELTNTGTEPGVRRGVLVAAVNYGTAHHLVIADLYIHDVNGTNEKKETGGILFRTVGNTRHSRFDDLLIERNIVWKVDRSAIVGQSSEFARSKWYPSLRVVIRDNFVDDIGGDGIVPWATDGALIEHNIALHCNHRAKSFNAGIWPWSTDNSLFELNEAAYTHTTLDGEGFDSDFNSRNTKFLYNYSHDNEGGFMLICTPVKRNQQENLGNTGTVIAYNISRNDHSRSFNLDGADQTTVEHNAIYIAPGDDVQILLVSPWQGWSHGAVFRNNTFLAEGTGRYGHEIKRNPDATHVIAPGWGEATDIRFDGNTYLGKNVDIPADANAVVRPEIPKAHPDWSEPAFDPAYPDQFPRFIVMHRRWLIHLFQQQFKQTPQLEKPQMLSAAQPD